MMLTLSGLAITPAFAASSTGYPNWSLYQTQRDYDSGSCDSSSNSCAYADNSGINYLFAKSYYSLGADTHNAYTRNQETVSPDSTASPPQLTTSAGTVSFAVDISSSGYITDAGSGGQQIAFYSYGGDVWQLSGGTYTLVKSFALTQSSPGPVSVSSTVTGYYSNSGTNTYRLGGSHLVSAQNNFVTGNTDVDFYTGSYYADTTRLQICDTC